MFTAIIKLMAERWLMMLIARSVQLILVRSRLHLAYKEELTLCIVNTKTCG